MAALIDLLQQNPAIFIGIVTTVSLMVGSFLNVVIYRLPVMMEREWHAQCRELLAIKDQDQNTSEQSLNLATPRSRCPHCGHAISALENIPILSYLVLRGRCRRCKASISPRYPIIEVSTALLSALVAWKLGFEWQTLAALVLTWALVALTMIDFDHQLLPDSITLPLVWIGLFLSLFGLFTNMQSSILGGIGGYISLWVIYHLFKIITGKEGMGYGDFKLFAVFGAWLGWQCLPVVILLSSFVGAVVGVSLIIFRGRDRNIPIPFGPYLAAAGWLYLLWGQNITDAYFRIVGIPV